MSEDRETDEEFEQRRREFKARHPDVFQGKEPELGCGFPQGWTALIDELCTDLAALLAAEPHAGFQVIQVKEKFGGLRFYWRLGDVETVRVDIAGVGSFGVTEGETSPLFDAITARVRKAEAQSVDLCGICGAAGKRNTSGYIFPYCPAHWPEDTV